ncbi:iron-sulfur cluster carrier protein ApbC [Egibacter rhizosphaerae]|uniref:Iron-sulfur cluster carrier protein n=1 Tax=Egibacter rhizosphaerae TaxID=1670831 RepID=A0A411YIW8_9ACTN|nr:Mrp/NBP35 family ATP-binding protein [Egibacter rhizosphaerae]QBI21218.1 iron-sulfur cluster carrier protein ApbC [Egibacter rhizosphaerae]
MANQDEVRRAVAELHDPLLDRPLGELAMVDGVRLDDGRAIIDVRLPVVGYPAAEVLRSRVVEAAAAVPGVDSAEVAWDVMSEEETAAVVSQVRPQAGSSGQQGGEPHIPFNDLDSDTKVFAVASGKGGVGKSSLTTNLAVALAERGQRVGILDADIWGYSIPRMLGVEGKPIALQDMVLPLMGHGVKVISIGFFLDEEKPVIWRGPMLHRALQQFLADVFWGELDFLLCDLPPGTGDIAISLAQMLPNADMLVVTTPQQAAQRVALRAGQTTAQTGMRVAGVVENMATFVAPDTGTEYAIFGEGGGALLATELGTDLLGSIPIDPRLREGADDGRPLVLSDPEAPASQRISEIADGLVKKKSSLVGKSLPLQF